MNLNYRLVRDAISYYQTQVRDHNVSESVLRERGNEFWGTLTHAKENESPTSESQLKPNSPCTLAISRLSHCTMNFIKLFYEVKNNFCFTTCRKLDETQENSC